MDTIQNIIKIDIPGRLQQKRNISPYRNFRVTSNKEGDPVSGTVYLPINMPDVASSTLMQ